MKYLVLSIISVLILSCNSAKNITDTDVPKKDLIFKEVSYRYLIPGQPQKSKLLEICLEKGETSLYDEIDYVKINGNRYNISEVVGTNNIINLPETVTTIKIPIMVYYQLENIQYYAELFELKKKDDLFLP